MSKRSMHSLKTSDSAERRISREDAGDANEEENAQACALRLVTGAPSWNVAKSEHVMGDC